MDDIPDKRDIFPTTHWSVITHAKEYSEDARQALEKLCQSYWYPVYAYIRRKGHEPDESKDLTQAFFAKLLEKNILQNVHRDSGRFRWFLQSTIKRFLVNEWHKAMTIKRGGTHSILSINELEAERRYELEARNAISPEKAFDQSWAMAVLEAARVDLEKEYLDRSALFNALVPCLSGDRSGRPYAELAEKLGMSESAIKAAVHRMRAKYRELIRSRIANTVTTAAEIDEEVRTLFAAFA